MSSGDVSIWEGGLISLIVGLLIGFITGREIHAQVTRRVFRRDRLAVWREAMEEMDATD